MKILTSYQHTKGRFISSFFAHLFPSLLALLLLFEWELLKLISSISHALNGPHLAMQSLKSTQNRLKNQVYTCSDLEQCNLSNQLTWHAVNAVHPVKIFSKYFILIHLLQHSLPCFIVVTQQS